MKRDALTASLVAIFGLMIAGVARADRTGYEGIVDVETSAGGVTCRHHHDWSDATRIARFNMIVGKTELFSEANTYAWLSCSKGDASLFKSPAPALTRLVMSGDGRFVVGVTHIKLWNPVQIAVWETASGKRLFATMVASQDACFSRDEYRQFLSAHPSMHAALHERAVLIGDVVHADMVYRESDEAALKELVAKRCPSYIARNIRESVTNSVDFYTDGQDDNDHKALADPHFRIENGSDGKPAFLEFLDVKGVPARVDLHPHYIEPDTP